MTVDTSRLINLARHLAGDGYSGETIRLLEDAAAEIDMLQALDREAATYVETVIATRTNFTGEPPYVGWKGLGLALTEALDELDLLRRERIVNSAVRYGGVVFIADMDECRHVDVIAAMRLINLDTVRMTVPDNQGFLTSDGRFVGRLTARRIAVSAGQIGPEKAGDELFSEDVW